MIDKKDLIKYARFLDKHKKYFGFEKYKILVADKTGKNPRHIAEASADQYKFEVKVILFKKFLKRDDKEEILIHELIHARIGLYQDRIDTMIEEIQYEMEEEAVNDITKGFMRLLNAKNSET